VAGYRLTGFGAERRLCAPEACADRVGSRAQISRFWACPATRSTSLGATDSGGVAATAAFGRGTNCVTIGRAAAMARSGNEQDGHRCAEPGGMLPVIG
jgi:hypothetical protein